MAKLALAAALKKRKLSKRQFAKRIGVSYTNVFKLFKGRQNPTLETLTKWSKAIGCKVRDLIKE